MKSAAVLPAQARVAGRVRPVDVIAGPIVPTAETRRVGVAAIRISIGPLVVAMDGCDPGEGRCRCGHCQRTGDAQSDRGCPENIDHVVDLHSFHTNATGRQMRPFQLQPSTCFLGRRLDLNCYDLADLATFWRRKARSLLTDP